MRRACIWLERWDKSKNYDSSAMALPGAVKRISLFARDLRDEQLFWVLGFEFWVF